MFKFGVIGYGNMGSAIIKGVIKSTKIKPNEILIYDSDYTKLDKSESFAFAQSEQEVFDKCEMILLSVIPQVFQNLLSKIKNFKPENGQIILTIAAGITSTYIKNFLGESTKVVTIMPNTPLIVGEGATAISKTKNIEDGEFTKIVDIFAKMGKVSVLDESDLINIVPAGGSTPALVCYFIEAIAQAVEKKGIEKKVAIELITQSFLGTAKMLQETGKSPEQLIEKVCSPGGMTIEAIKVFEQENLKKIIEDACNNCISRGYEIRSPLKTP